MSEAYGEIVMGMLVGRFHKACLASTHTSSCPRKRESSLRKLSKKIPGLRRLTAPAPGMTMDNSVSEPEHMVEGKPAGAVIHAVEAEQAAGGVADQHISRISRRANLLGREIIGWIDQRGTGTGNF